MPAVTQQQQLSSVVRMQKARTTLLLDHPFFGTLLFRLGARPLSSIKTMATDGVSLFFNPDFVDALNAAELAGVLAHEVMHPALQHHTRRGDRDAKRWNMACDYAIYPMLIDAGLTLPKDVLLDPRFRGMSAERIYNLIEEQENEDGPCGEQESQSATADGAPSDRQDEEGADDTKADGEPTAPTTPGGFGQVLDAPEREDGEGESVAEQERDWKIAVEQAENVATLAGKLPAGVTRSLEQSEAAGVDWRELLRRAWSETIPADYSWMPPNRRYIWSGLYLPGIRSEGVGEIAIAVDCSGSVHARQLGLFEAEVRSILEGQRPRLVHVLYFDTDVHRVETYYAGQPVTLAPVGGGGTSFAPCFEWLTEHGVCPQTLVFLTDLCGTFPREAPSYPVLWASTETRAA
ncbi:MAG TPA: VWA-like domain-containing protein, partial [Silvibacterium sp.]|nr:VWA-like domain-containing protein [Silvibacterium sp.]